MFRLISLNFQNEILGHIPKDKLVFVPNNERIITKYPYASVIIGQNGSGKSTILSYIAEIFIDLQNFKENNERLKKPKINFIYSIEFETNNYYYKISQRRGIPTKGVKEEIVPPGWFYQLTINGNDLQGNKNDWDLVELPKNVITVCYLPMDRFPKKSNLENDEFYYYLGLVDISNAARPRFIMNNAVPMLMAALIRDKSFKLLRNILTFMKVDYNYLGIKTIYRYKEHFFSGNLTDKSFVDLFKNWGMFSDRKEKPFGVNYFETQIANDSNLISKIVKYINTRVEQDKIQVGKKSILEFNLFKNIEIFEEWELMIHLKKLDLIESFSLLFRKNNNKNIIDDFKLSTGEFHYFSTMIAISGCIKENSLILIDEPETSFHPNWQMKYINHLKLLFQNFNSAHFIIASHSHFIVSDLEGKSSEVIGLIGTAPNMQVKPIRKNTYGWSAEQVLLEVFQTATTRNYFFIDVVDEILKELSKKDFNKEHIIEKIKQLKDYDISGLRDNDPMKEIISKLLKKIN